MATDRAGLRAGDRRPKGSFTLTSSAFPLPGSSVGIRDETGSSRAAGFCTAHLAEDRPTGALPPAAETTIVSLSRRKFMQWATGIGSAVMGGLVGWPALRAFLSPAFRAPK